MFICVCVGVCIHTFSIYMHNSTHPHSCIHSAPTQNLPVISSLKESFCIIRNWFRKRCFAQAREWMHAVLHDAVCECLLLPFVTHGASPAWWGFSGQQRAINYMYGPPGPATLHARG